MSWESPRIVALLLLTAGGCYTPDPVKGMVSDDTGGETDTPTSTAPTGLDTMTTMSTMTTGPTSGMTSPTTSDETDSATTDDTSADTSSGGGTEFCGEPTPLLSFSLAQTYDVGGSVGNLYTTNLFGPEGTHIVAANLTEPRIDLLSNNRLLGMFSVATSITVEEEISVGVGDLNNNGVDDLAVADRGTIEAYLFDGQDFTQGGPITTASDAVWAVAIADFGGSPFGEVAVQTNGEPAAVEIYGGIGTNIEGPPLIYPAGRRTTAMIPAFIDGDERIDLVVARTDADHEVPTDAFTVMLNRSDNDSISFETSNVQTDSTPWGMSIVDLNGDGSEDIVIASQGETANDGVDDTVQVFLNDGNGSFTAQAAIEVADTLGQLAVGDLDCDGLDDVAVVSITGVYVLRGNGTGLDAAERVFDPDGLPLGIVTGYFNADDRLDIAIGTADTGEVQLFIAD